MKRVAWPRRVTGEVAGAAFGTTRQFLFGVWVVFRGCAMLFRRPQWWPFALLPMLATVIVFGIGTWWIVDWGAESFSQWLSGETSSWAPGWLTSLWYGSATMVGIALSLLALYLFYLPLVRALAAPFLALFSERVFASLSGIEAPVPPGRRVVRWVIRPIYEALILLVIRLIVSVVFLPLNCIPAVGTVLFFLVLAWLEGMDLLDIGMSARGLVLRERLPFVKRHKFAAMGLGVGASAILWVPIVNLFFLPGLIVAAVLLDQRLSEDFPMSPKAGLPEASS